MKSIFFLCFAGLLAQSLNAQIQGPLSAATFTVEAIPGSTKTWIDPSNAALSDDTYTTFGNITGGIGSYTDYLVATNFGFTIPALSLITGIIVEVERADPNFRTADHQIRIVKGGVTGSTERSVGSGFPFSDSYQSYGNAGDLWGETWAASDINSSGFGVAVAARRSVAGGTTAGRIDHIRIIVFYNFNTLPLRLINFTAIPNNHSVLLKWITTDEVNMQQYEVERSVNALDYISIKTIASQNQLSQTTYSSVDNNPVAGMVYYRLKTLENNGSIKYSKVVSLYFKKMNTISIYPSLWKPGEALMINNPENEKLNIIFYSLSGQRYGMSVINSYKITTEPIDKAKGIILYQLINSSGKMIARGKLIVSQ